MMLIAVLDDYQNVAQSLAEWANLAPRAQAIFFHDHVVDLDQLATRLEPFEIVVLMRERTAFGAELIARLPKLKLIATFGMWNAAIDLSAAAAKGVLVSGTEGGDPDATPALTFALILALTRNLYNEAASVRAGGWQVGLGVDIAGKTLGILGLGPIGQKVAKLGNAFGMDVIAWSRNLTSEAAAALGARRVDKEVLFRKSDVLTLHLKLNEGSRGLVGKRELDLMKQTSFLVNTSRGPIVDEQALIRTLQERRIAGAALDVFEPEPLSAHHPFRYLPNVLATPHLGGASFNRHHHGYAQSVENIAAFLDGAPIRLLRQRN